MSILREKIGVAVPAAATVLLVIAAGCNNASPPAGEAGGSTASGASAGTAKAVIIDTIPAKGTLQVTSPDFTAGQPIPDRFSDYGGKQTPTIQWSRPPAGTKSLAVLVEDPDAPGAQPYVHWVVVDIPPTATSIGPKLPSGAVAGTNSTNAFGYFGPHPPPGDPPHHYHFQVFALDTHPAATPGIDRTALVGALTGHVLAKGELVATYGHS